jgi:hypothetical protein
MLLCRFLIGTSSSLPGVEMIFFEVPLGIEGYLDTAAPQVIGLSVCRPEIHN